MINELSPQSANWHNINQNTWIYVVINDGLNNVVFNLFYINFYLHTLCFEQLGF